jgi:hypothetical protein
MGASLGTTLTLPAGGPSPWLLDLSAGALERAFDGPDPAISTAGRYDTRAFVQGVLTVPLAQGWAAQAAVGYSRQLSNYDVYTFSDTSTSLALTKSF